MFQLRARDLAPIVLALALALILALGLVLFGVDAVVDSPAAAADMYLKIADIKGE